MKWHDLTIDIFNVMVRDEERKIDLGLYRPRFFSSWRSLVALCFLFLIALIVSLVLGDEISTISLFLPVAIGAYSTIFATEVDANSPENAVLWGKVKDNFDFLYAKFNATTGHKHTGAADDAPTLVAGSYTAGSVDQNAIGASAVGLGELKLTFADFSIPSTAPAIYTVQFRFGHTFTLFYPAIRLTLLGISSALSARIMENNAEGAGSPAVDTTFYNFLWMQFTTSASTAVSMVARIYYVLASRDDPTVFILRKKTTGKIKAAMFVPEILGKDELHPFPDYWDDPDHECIVIELNNNEILKRYLFKNTIGEAAGVVQPILDMIGDGKIKLGEMKDSITPIEFAPCLHGPFVKVLDFDYNAPEEVTTEYNEWKEEHEKLKERIRKANLKYLKEV